MASAFLVGATLVRRFQRRPGAAAVSSSSVAPAADAAGRPAVQIPVRGIDQLVSVTHTMDLMRSIERRTRFSAAQFERDCRPVLESFAEFVQMLPASECHHHAQPGGLWIHALEVVDAALTFRAGLELPPGASTEDRKRQEHRWTFAVLAAALLHDVGKPVTDLRVMMFSQDPRAGRAWAPLAGTMRVNGALFYSVAFTTPTERDYQAHQKLAAMLLHQFVPPRLMRWLAEEGEVLQQLLAYLAGEAPQGPNSTLPDIVKRADSDSVRRNLLHGPRTRFSTARTRPLVERLMEALRRMLQEGAVLPLNRPGAAGWVHDGCIWFVCARLAEEVRNYLAQHESAQGVPGKDRNDRMFDTWQESGVARAAPDGGAIWRVRVECEAWKSPDVLTVLCFPLDKVYVDPQAYPQPMRGRILVEAAAAVVPAPAGGVAAGLAASPALSPTPAHSSVAISSRATQLPAIALPPVVAPNPPQGPPTAPAPVASSSAPPKPTAASKLTAAAPSAARSNSPATTTPPPAPTAHATSTSPGPSSAPAAKLSASPADVPPADETPVDAAPPIAAPVSTPEPTSQTMRQIEPRPAPATDDSDVLSAEDSARLIEPATQLHSLPAAAATAFKLGAPMRPHQAEHPRPKKAPSPAAEALMAWVAHAVGSGQLKYNEDQALVHFVPEGCLLLSPEIFRRFMDLHQAMPDGPVAALLAAHGDRAFARLQNELAKSGWTQRNGDENMHHYAFTKADGRLSRPASFFLVPQPELFWNPVPRANDRIRKVPRPKKLAVPVSVKAQVPPIEPI